MFSYLICTYIVLKFNNDISLRFRILCTCNSIYVEKTKHTQVYIYLPVITLIVHP